MNIGKLGTRVGVTPDTVRYYERQGLLDAPQRSANGYRTYGEADVARLRFVRAAQALGFSLAEICAIVPRLSAGLLDRAEIETHLQAKIAEIDTTLRTLRDLRRELLATFASLRCTADCPVSVEGATARPAQGAVPVRKRRLSAMRV